MFTKSLLVLVLYTQAIYAHVPRKIGLDAENRKSSALDTSDPLSLVNVFIGTTNGGNVFPGSFLN